MPSVKTTAIVRVYKPAECGQYDVETTEFANLTEARLHAHVMLAWWGNAELALRMINTPPTPSEGFVDALVIDTKPPHR